MLKEIRIHSLKRHLWRFRVSSGETKPHERPISLIGNFNDALSLRCCWGDIVLLEGLDRSGTVYTRDLLLFLMKVPSIFKTKKVIHSWILDEKRTHISIMFIHYVVALFWSVYHNFPFTQAKTNPSNWHIFLCWPLLFDRLWKWIPQDFDPKKAQF